MSNRKVLILTSLLILFLFPRLLIIHTYPPFNDESIHLAWARKMVTEPTARFISMKWGGKQPLPFWLFGIAESFLPNKPFLAGRLVSLGFSLLALIGIYKLTLLVAKGWKTVSSRFYQLTAIFASLAFALSPYVIFIGVQVLMEIMVFAAAVWSLYFLLLVLRDYKIKDAMIAGAILGIGFWIKSTMIIFIGLAFLSLLATIFAKLLVKKETQAKKLRLPTITMAISLALVLLPLVTHPSFTYLSQWNKLYGFSLAELLRFPISTWLTNMLIGLIWYLWYLTPFFFILWLPLVRLLGSIRRLGKINWRHFTSSILIFWFLAAYFATAIIIRSPSLRYFLPSTFPLFPLFGLSLAQLYSSFRRMSIYQALLLLFIFVPMTISAAVLSWQPHNFILWLDKIAPFTGDRFHLVSGWPSGYGVPQAIDFIAKQSKKAPLTLLIRYDSGNPEDAMITAFLPNPNVKLIMVGQLRERDKQKLIQQLRNESRPIYFVSRGSQLAGLDNYLTKVKHYPKPASKEYVGVYKLEGQN